MSQNVLEEINKKMEEMVEGRRYIIRQVGSLKVSVDELIEKLKAGLGAPAAGGFDFEGLTSVITALTEEVGKLHASNLDELIKTGFEDLKNILSDLKGKATPSGESFAKLDELANRIENLQSNIEQLTQIMQKTVETFNEKLANITSSGEPGVKLNEVLERLNKIDNSLSSLLEKKTELSEREPADLKDAVKKIVTTVLDLRAAIESSEESFIYGLKLVENNIRRELAAIGFKTVSCVEDAFEKLRESLKDEPANEIVYDALLDLLYNLKNTNKFDERINAILGFIRELKSKPAESKVDPRLKAEIVRALLS
ncbi:MAG: hypothetical protein OdinLCB4_006430 [Candidatus Odinarchaeum yellowstonii]|uniref:Uncharacterized protein n=1 Tax=Odinarchaeota yellowstonii (strain LCB_4) TaxID=1841599 RepID=A0AAF0D1U2_ODILC|nr:MAG: hypothetical protein OdinLCB4_006430 [Candidatus Odinarchaeum yellowstonii]